MAGEIWREKGGSSGREKKGAVVLAAEPFGFCFRYALVHGFRPKTHGASGPTFGPKSPRTTHLSGSKGPVSGKKPGGSRRLRQSARSRIKRLGFLGTLRCAKMKRPPPRQRGDDASAGEGGSGGGFGMGKGKGRWGGGSRRRNEQRLGVGGGGALSLAAFASAKSRNTGYNPALISEYHLRRLIVVPEGLGRSLEWD